MREGGIGGRYSTQNRDTGSERAIGERLLVARAVTNCGLAVDTNMQETTPTMNPAITLTATTLAWKYMEE